MKHASLLILSLSLILVLAGCATQGPPLPPGAAKQSKREVPGARGQVSGLKDSSPDTSPIALGTSVVTLAWDPSPDATVTGYLIHFGEAPATYTRRQEAGTNWQATITNLFATNYFVATAYDANLVESEYSNELRYVVPTSPAPPTDLRFQLTTQSQLPGGSWTNIHSLTLINPPGNVNFLRVHLVRLP